MFSASRLFAKWIFSPKNGPVPDQGVNGYEDAQRIVPGEGEHNM